MHLVFKIAIIDESVHAQSFLFKSNIFNVIDCKTWWGRDLTEMNVPSKTTTVYILKHIMALSTMLLRILMHCSVIFMHTILYNMLFKRDMPFLRHDDKKMFWGNYFASIYSLCQKSKDYKCFAKMVSRLLKCFITVTFKIVTLNKEESSTVIRCMINQNMNMGNV